jgi:hypothetical protein
MVWAEMTALDWRHEVGPSSFDAADLEFVHALACFL